MRVLLVNLILLNVAINIRCVNGQLRGGGLSSSSSAAAAARELNKGIQTPYTDTSPFTVPGVNSSTEIVIIPWESLPPPYPDGPYIVPGINSSELVIIPEPPPPPSPPVARHDCPHLQGGLSRWHDDLVWSKQGSFPDPGSDFRLPENTRVLLDQPITGIFGIITIPASSELILGETVDPGGIGLSMRGMQVYGKLTAGSTTCRIETPITLTLHGTRPADAVVNPQLPHVKGIAVDGGTVSLHGKRYYHTWTRLAKTVEIDSNIILLQHQVNWESGQQILLVTTAMKDSKEWHQNEVLTIDKVYSNNNPQHHDLRVGAVVVVRERTKYRHVANLNYQGEVGLLSRTLTIQGSQWDSEPTDPDPLTCKGQQMYGSKNRPCADRDLTGYGGHVMVYNNGTGYVEGVQFHRMGQTNVLGRYPMHFHLLGDCSDCYVRDSSFYRSYYRCISVHATNQVSLLENVAFDITGFCYYLEDGIEEDNYIGFNLAAHIHVLGDPAWGFSQGVDAVEARDDLILPADVAASGFYITNVHNWVVGNAASGGWSGFAFPNLPTPLQTHRDLKFRPSSVTSLAIEGNTAHSTGWFWEHAGGFYFGGSLYYNDRNILEYNPGRDFSFADNSRNPCKKNNCELHNNCQVCYPNEKAWVRVGNSKVFLVPGVAFNSWSGRMEVMGIETHDVGLSLQSLSDGFWLKDLLSVCRTGEPIVMPPEASMAWVRADGFAWYDTGQEHIITDATFRNCGYRSFLYNHYDDSPSRGCRDDCWYESSVWSFLAVSDQHVPELMQGTRNIRYDNCGRRFKLYNYNNNPITVAGRGQAWDDADGSASGTHQPTIIASGYDEVTGWWQVDNEVIYDPQGPLRFIRKHGSRSVGHVSLRWDDSIHAQIGEEICRDGDAPCPRVGTVRHLGHRFSPLHGGPNQMIVTANADIVGPTGGFGWLLELDGGAPKALKVEFPEIMPDSTLILCIPYPPSTAFTITARASTWCWSDDNYSCVEQFTAVGSIDEVRHGLGNTYHVDGSGVLWMRLIQGPIDFVGRPEWFVPGYDDSGRSGGFAWTRFARGGVVLPKLTFGPHVLVEADCPGEGAYCDGTPQPFDPDVCPQGYIQTAYDRCCLPGNLDYYCMYADSITLHS